MIPLEQQIDKHIKALLTYQPAAIPQHSFAASLFDVPLPEALNHLLATCHDLLHLCSIGRAEQENVAYRLGIVQGLFAALVNQRRTP